MLQKELEEFAKALIRQVRDLAISNLDGQIQQTSLSPPAKRWRERSNGAVPGALALEPIPDCVDAAVFEILNAIDSGNIRLFFRASSGDLLDLAELGMGNLESCYLGKDGFVERYSAQRCADDFSDLTLD